MPETLDWSPLFILLAVAGVVFAPLLITIAAFWWGEIKRAVRGFNDW